MQFHKYGKLHERSVVSEFSCIEVVWLAFSHKPKKIVFFLQINSQNFWDVFVTVSKPWLTNTTDRSGNKLTNTSDTQGWPTQTKQTMVYSKLDHQIFDCLAFTLHWKRPEMPKILHKWYTESSNLLNFDKNFQRCLFSKFEFWSYQTLIKAYINMQYKRSRFFSLFEAKLSR